MRYNRFLPAGGAALVLWLSLAAGAGGQAAPARPAFEAVSIKPNVSGGNRHVIDSHPGRLAIVNYPLNQLIQYAYGLRPYQVEGPDWMGSVYFDITATVPAGIPNREFGALLQPFLEKQFRLATHRETKPLPVYALVVAKGGPKHLTPIPFGGSISANSSGAGVHLEASCSMACFAGQLSRQTDRPVVDQTGLSEVYKFTLDFTPDRLADAQTEAGGAAAANPTLFTALQEQLGLRLQPTKAPIEILVVDHAEKTPLGNE